jgi:hypothetical protein
MDKVKAKFYLKIGTADRSITTEKLSPIDDPKSN